MELTQSRPPAAASGPDKFDSVCAILERYSYQPAKLIPILQAVQNEYRYLPEGVMTYVATALKVPPARVFGVATFYTYFALEPKGKHVLRLCDGTACHVKQSIPILEALRRHLGLDEKNKTTPDMLFTLDTVACLGACGLAPVLMVDDVVHSRMTPAAAVKLVDKIRTREQSAN
ncbi:MAG: NADH dehydrogenase [Lentisphaerae bacterium RIFOXYB12_FULL_65_16]|nr:MAG: NADH dehydrogenase [Lentisphaerae bacterium RIFOXYA12_64_32]OGV94402.1 MAG: NADH dehydrogenase [Lentisphaerae bacterium RIFOXYB12_FULL_65_16]